jgi:hypothetical protein
MTHRSSVQLCSKISTPWRWYCEEKKRLEVVESNAKAPRHITVSMSNVKNPVHDHPDHFQLDCNMFVETR